MCLAIYQRAGSIIPEGYLAEGFRNNPDGAGFMFFDENNDIQVFKSMKFDKFIDEYEKQWALHGERSPFAIHFRWATHGQAGIMNVHPFKLGEHVTVMHNGVINCHIEDRRDSDTAAFVKHYLGSLPRNWYDNKYLFDMVEDYTSGSKLIVFSSDPDSEYVAYIFNERLGHMADDVWYSNSSYSCTKPGIIPFKSAEQSALAFSDEDYSHGIIQCELCGEESVLDDICYNCESCQECWMTEEDCKCNGATFSLHGMTDANFGKYYSS